MSDAGSGGRLARPRVAFLLSALLLAFTADERVFGLVTDGQIMTRTAYSIFSLGEIGTARGHRVNIPRPAGDAVTRYGIGPTLVRVLPVSLAGPWERAFGVGSSQTLFVLMNILLDPRSRGGGRRAREGMGRRRRGGGVGDPRVRDRVAPLGVRRLRLFRAASGRSRRGPFRGRRPFPRSPAFRAALPRSGRRRGGARGGGAPLEVDLHRPGPGRARPRGLGRSFRVAAPAGARGRGGRSAVRGALARLRDRPLRAPVRARTKGSTSTIRCSTASGG